MPSPIILSRSQAKNEEYKAGKRRPRTLTAKDLEGLEARIREKLKWDHTPREFQMRAIKAQLQCKDVLLHAGTGFGKTTIAAGPHAHPVAEGRVTFMVSPLIALQEEQVSSFLISCKSRSTRHTHSNYCDLGRYVPA